MLQSTDICVHIDNYLKPWLDLGLALNSKLSIRVK